MRGYTNRQLKDWERARLIAYNIYASIPKKKGTSNQSIYSWLPLSTDQNRPRKMSDEKNKELRKFFVNKQQSKTNDN